MASRNLPKRKARTILTITAVFLGVALLVGINMATASALGEFNSYINKFWGATDIVVTYGTEAPFANQTVLTKVVHNPEVAQTAERLDWFGGSGTPSSNATFILSGLDPTGDFDYSSFNMTGTRPFTMGQAVVDNVIAQKLGVGIGSNLNIFTVLPTSNQSQIKPLSFSLEIVGINYPLRTLGSTVYMSLPQLQSLLGLGGNVTRVFARLYDPTQALSVQSDLQKQLPSYDVSAPKAEAVQRIHAQTTGFEIGLNVMIGVSLVVCSFIVFNTLFMSVSERTYEIGVLRAIGSSRSQVFRIFLAEGLLIGAIGTVVGIVGGLGLARLITILVETTFNIPNLPVADLTLPIALTGLAAGFGAVLAGALYPAISASQVNIMQAIRPSARNASREIPLSLVGVLGILMVGIGAAESLRLFPFHVNYLDVVLVPIGLVLIGSVIYGKAGPALTLPL
ncbi:MAG TPA: FtsX-like permease family protein, partial [Candidatus Bathyarchaeia archaeon]|nr:FtsX-like permease family protein [Candidatus Bathyarchaeia archaeon]